MCPSDASHASVQRGTRDKAPYENGLCPRPEAALSVADLDRWWSVEGYSRSEAIRWFISEGLFAAEKARAKEPTKS